MVVNKLDIAHSGYLPSSTLNSIYKSLGTNNAMMIWINTNRIYFECRRIQHGIVGFDLKLKWNVIPYLNLAGRMYIFLNTLDSPVKFGWNAGWNKCINLRTLTYFKRNLFECHGVFYAHNGLWKQNIWGWVWTCPYVDSPWYHKRNMLLHRSHPVQDNGYTNVMYNPSKSRRRRNMRSELYTGSYKTGTFNHTCAICSREP